MATTLLYSSTFKPIVDEVTEERQRRLVCPEEGNDASFVRKKATGLSTHRKRSLERAEDCEELVMVEDVCQSDATSRGDVGGNLDRGRQSEREQAWQRHRELLRRCGKRWIMESWPED